MSASNHVAPCRERLVDRNDKPYLGEYLVDADGIPGLVARGVVPFRYLKLRQDFPTRFADCADVHDVRRVLAAEGYYEVP